MLQGGFLIVKEQTENIVVFLKDNKEKKIKLCSECAIFCDEDELIELINRLDGLIKYAKNLDMENMPLANCVIDLNNAKISVLLKA